MQKFLVMLVCSLLATACGGGSDDVDDSPPEIGTPPTVDVTFQVEGISSLPPGDISFTLGGTALTIGADGTYTVNLEEDSYTVEMDIPGVGSGQLDFTVDASDGATQNIDVPLTSVISGFETAVADLTAPVSGLLASDAEDLQIALFTTDGTELAFNELRSVHMSSRPDQRDLNTDIYPISSNNLDLDVTAAFVATGNIISLADATVLAAAIGTGGTFQVDIWAYNSTTETLYRARTVVSLADRSITNPIQAYRVRLLDADRRTVDVLAGDVSLSFSDIGGDFETDIAENGGVVAVYQGIYRSTELSDGFAAGITSTTLVDADLQMGGELYFRANPALQNLPMVSSAAALSSDPLGNTAAGRLGLAAGTSAGATMSAISSAENTSVRAVDVVNAQNSIEVIFDVELASQPTSQEAGRMGFLFSLMNDAGAILDQQVVRLADLAEPDLALPSANGFLATRLQGIRFDIPGEVIARTLYVMVHMKRETTLPFVINWGVADTLAHLRFIGLTAPADPPGGQAFNIAHVHTSEGANAVTPRALRYDDVYNIADNAKEPILNFGEVRIYSANNSLLYQSAANDVLNAEGELEIPLDFSFAPTRENHVERLFIELDINDFITRTSQRVYPLDGLMLSPQARAGVREEGGGDSFVAIGGSNTMAERIDALLAFEAAPLIDDLSRANGIFSTRGGHEDGRQVHVDFFGDFLILRLSALTYLRVEQLVVQAVNDSISEDDEEELINWVAAQRRAMMSFGRCAVFYGPEGRAVPNVLPVGWLGDLLNTLEFVDTSGQRQRVLRFEEDRAITSDCARTDLDDPDLDGLMVPLPNMLDHFHIDFGIASPMGAP